MRQHRGDKVMERGEYLSRVRETAPRGQELSHSVLLDVDVVSIRSASRQRESLRQHIKATLSNEALAKTYGVSQRTIERVLAYETWSHVA